MNADKYKYFPNLEFPPFREALAEKKTENGRVATTSYEDSKIGHQVKAAWRPLEALFEIILKKVKWNFLVIKL